MREIIISECVKLLNNYNFTVSQSYSRSCFDILARKNDLKFLIKVLKNIDSLSIDQSKELIKISSILNAIPLLIGVRTRNFSMEDNVVYERHNIKAITYETFKQYLDGSPPIVYASRGGFFVNIDGEMLRKIREKLNISVGELAEYSNVSRKTIYKYEQNLANPSIDVALKIEQYLDVPLIREVDLTPNELKKRKNNNKNAVQQCRDYDNKNIEADVENEFKLQVINILNELGFNLVETKKAPFDAVAEKYDNHNKYDEEYYYEHYEYNGYKKCIKNEYNQMHYEKYKMHGTYSNKLLFTNIDETETEETRKKAMILNQISNILDGYSLIILEKAAKNIKPIKTISLKELEKMDDAFELIEYIVHKSRN